MYCTEARFKKLRLCRGVSIGWLVAGYLLSKLEKTLLQVLTMPLRKKSDKSNSTNSLNKGSSTTGTGGEEWKEIQMRVYTNWVNDKLKTTDQHVKKLTKELGNGVLLIKLLELISGKKIPGK